MTKWKAAQFLIACVMGFWAVSAFGTESLHEHGYGTRFPAVGWCQHQTPTREAEMNKSQFATTEVIAQDIADYIGPNWRDFRPVSEIVTEFVAKFGHYRIDQVPERFWVPFINSMERRDVSRNYPTPGAYSEPYMSLDF